MKMKFILSLIIAANLIPSSAFANKNNINDCIRYIDNHRYQFFLDLINCRIQDKDIPSVLDYLYQNPNIQVLFLDENNIGPDGAKLLANEITVNYLGIDDNHIGNDGAEALAQSKSLAGLSLANNYISTNGALSLAKSTTISNLNISNNDIQPSGITAIANNTHIKYLSIAESTLDSASIAALINNKNIIGFDVSYTNIDYNDVVALLNRPILETLSINGLHLGDQITSVLAQNKSLNYLDIVDNNITSKGAVALTDLLHEDFVDLNISHNPIGDQGIAALAKASTTFLPFLSVEDGNISDEGALAFAKTTTLIMDLNISHNYISSKGIAALSSNRQIVNMDASYNQATRQYKVANNPIDNTSVNKIKYSKIKSYCANKISPACVAYLRSMHTQ